MRDLYTEERGISPVVATLLLLSLFIGIFAVYMSVTIPGEFASKEKEHMSEVRDSFLTLQSAVQEMWAGESRSISVSMSANLVSGTFRGPSIGGRLAAVETTVISENTVALWLMDKGSGTTVQDETTNNNDGTISGAVDWTTGRYDEGLRFENTGTPEYVNVPYSTSLNFVSGDFTIECWVKPAASYPTAQNGWRIFVRQDNTLSGEWTYAWLLGYDEWNEGVAFELKDDAGDLAAKVEYPMSLSAGTWYHIAGVKDGTDVKLYINGDLKHTATYSGGYPAPGDIYIGGWHTVNPGTTEAFNGAIDEVRIENRALKDSEIAERAKRGTLYFEIQNAYYSPQTYVYERGAVILAQPLENKSLMISPPTMIDVTPYGTGDNIKVCYRVLQLIGSSEATSTGTETLTVSVENTWQTSMPSQPNMENVTIAIHSDYRDAWRDYLVGLIEQLRDDGIYAAVDLQNLQLTIHGENTTSGVKDIYFVREFKNVYIAIS